MEQKILQTETQIKGWLGQEFDDTVQHILSSCFNDKMDCILGDIIECELPALYLCKKIVVKVD
jgi:hypothetical protein